VIPANGFLFSNKVVVVIWVQGEFGDRKVIAVKVASKTGKENVDELGIGKQCLGLSIHSGETRGLQHGKATLSTGGAGCIPNPGTTSLSEESVSIVSIILGHLY
jgi:hypothetical protein